MRGRHQNSAAGNCFVVQVAHGNKDQLLHGGHTAAYGLFRVDLHNAVL
jgi:hypothetical protein